MPTRPTRCLVSAPREDRVVARFRRLYLRKQLAEAWHFFGLQLWLQQRPALRYQPVPYLNVESVTDLMENGRKQANMGYYPNAYLSRMGRQSSQLVLEGIELRRRMGNDLAFVENPVMLEMLNASKSRAGVMGRVRQKVKEEEKARLQAVQRPTGTAITSLLGPKGGLPRTKADLQKLCQALGVDSTGLDIEQTQKKCRSIIEEYKSLEGTSTIYSGGSSGATPTSTASTRTR